MKKLLKSAIVFACLTISLSAAATTGGYVTVSGSNLKDSTGKALANATISFAPVNNSGVAIGFKPGGAGGQTTFLPVSALVTNGAFSITLPDTTATSPANVCFSVTAVDNVDGVSLMGPGYSCVQPHSASTGGGDWCAASVCNFDSYTPNLTPLVISLPGTPGPAGPQGASGGTANWRLAWSAGSSYAIFDAVSYSGSSYIATAVGTGHEPDISPSYWQLLAQAGAVGAAGATGATSPQGPTGPTGPAGSGAGASAIYYNLADYGGVPDMKGLGVWPLWGFALSGNTLTCGSCAFPSTVNNRVTYVKLMPSTSTWSPGAPFSTAPGNVALITGWTNSTTVTLALTSSTNPSGYMYYGTDASDPTAACYADAYAKTRGGICTGPAGAYFYAKTSYNVLIGASYAGDYGTPAGGSGTVNCTAASGGLGVCTATGSGFKHNATLQTGYASGGCSSTVPPWNYGPCGWALVTVQTDNSGNPSGTTIKFAGQKLTSSVVFNIIPLGGDGATATTTLTSGTANNPTGTAGGDGYLTSSAVSWFEVGGGCAVYQIWGDTPIVGTGTAPTNSSGSVSGTFTTTHAATGCTTPPTVIFGPAACNTGTFASPVWSQCTDIAALYPTALPTAVVDTIGVGIAGSTEGNGTGFSPVGTWDGITVDDTTATNLNTQGAIFAGTLMQSSFNSISPGGAFICKWNTNNANMSVVRDNNFGCGIDWYTYAEDLGLYADHNSYGGAANHINGGTLTTRLDVVNEGGGIANAGHENDTIVRQGQYAGVGSVQDKIDRWFDGRVARSFNSANSVDFASQPLTPFTIAQTQTGHVIGTPQAANFLPYKGITSICGENMAAGGRGGGYTEMHGLTCKQSSFGIFYGYLSTFDIWGFSSEGNTFVTTSPYRGSNFPGYIDFDDEGAAIWNPSASGVVGTPAQYMLFSEQTQGAPMYTEWHQLACPAPAECAIGEAPTVFNWQTEQDFPWGISLAARLGGGLSAADFYYGYAGAQHRSARVIGIYNGLSILGPDYATSMLDLSSGSPANFHENIIAPLFTPSSSSASCTTGQFSDDANFHYVCTSSNTWKRAALTSF